MKPKLLFIYDMENDTNWRDGLWAALNLLEDDFDIHKVNINSRIIDLPNSTSYDFILGWGAFDSAVDKMIERQKKKGISAGLCLSAYFAVDGNDKKYDVIFYETEWARKWLEVQGITVRLVHAFGVNTDIYKPIAGLPIVWDWITVGFFGKWHRQVMLNDKEGNKLAIGKLQLGESEAIVSPLLLNGCTISSEVEPEKLAQLYNMSKTAYLPGYFGHERAVLEARACGIGVLVEDEKLKELEESPIWDASYYAQKLKEGILPCLK